jgi:hypothetical protein
MDTLNLVEKIAEISGKIGAISKERKKDSKLSYGYQGIDELVNALNPLMAAAGIISKIKMLDCKVSEVSDKSGARAFVHIEVIVTDGISYQSTEEAALKHDFGDKAVTQAISMAYKYALLRLFKVQTKDTLEPDEYAKDHYTPVTEYAASKSKQPDPPKKPMTDNEIKLQKAAFLAHVYRNITEAEFNMVTPAEKNDIFKAWVSGENKDAAIQDGLKAIAHLYNFKL